jgi:hypothetical protein
MSKNTGTSELINYFDLGANGDVGIAGSLDVNTIANATTDTDKFLVSDTGIIKYRTGAELLTDIGAQGLLTNPITGSGTTNYLPKFTGSTSIGNSQVFDNGTSVGINTATPATTLDVNGVGLFTGTSLIGNTKNGVYIYDQSILSLAGNGARPLNIQGQTLSIYTGNTYSEKLKVFENGNVVISTSPVDAGYKLDVNGTGRFSGGVTIGNDVGYALTYGRYSAGIPISYLRAGTDSTGGFRLTNHNGADVIVVNGSNAITLDGALSVTGAATFSSTLTFSGLLTSLKTSGEVFAATSATTGSLYQRFQNSGSQLFFGIDNSTGSDFGGGNYSANIYSGSNVNLNFATNNAIRLTITGGGNVGIGTATPNLTAANRAVLDINGTNNSLLVFSSGGTYKSYIYNDGVGLTLQAATLQFETSFIPRIHVTSLGNVGIGTTSPTTRLHVEVPTGTDQVARFSRGPSNAGDIMFGLGDYGGGYQSRIGALQLAFEVNRANGAGLDTGTTAMFIKSSGNVLIGTTTDNGLGRLQVNGTITVAGGVRFSSSGADANRWSVYWNGGTGDLIVVNNISDIRAKKDFDYNIKGLETIQKLKPLKFTWKDGTSHSTSVSGRLRQYGFIAQETMEADDYLAWHNQSQDTWGIEQYESFSAVIIKAIQEQQQQIDKLKNA